MQEGYTTRQMKIKTENVEKLKTIKKESGRSMQWVTNAALEYYFEQKWDDLIK